MDVLEGGDDLVELPKPLLDSFIAAKKIIDDLSERVIETGLVKVCRNICQWSDVQTTIQRTS